MIKNVFVPAFCKTIRILIIKENIVVNSVENTNGGNSVTAISTIVTILLL